jgi:Ca2+-binding RTX toxin-like protein
MAEVTMTGGIETLTGGSGNDDYIFGTVNLIDTATILDSGGVDRFVVTWGTNAPEPGTSGEFINTGTSLVWRALGGHEIIIELDETGQSEIEFLVWRAPSGFSTPDRILTVVTDLNNIVGTDIAVVGTDGDDVIVSPHHDAPVARYSEIYANAGNDRVTLSDTAQMIAYGGLGNDTITGVGGMNDYFRGDGGADLLRASGGNDKVNGNDGSDRLFGDAGMDTLLGDNGNDRLVGGKGNDLLTGGAGLDSFIFQPSANSDLVADWQDGIDRIVLQGFGVVAFRDIRSAISSDGDDAIISLTALGGTGTLTVVGASGLLNATDFQFA